MKFDTVNTPISELPQRAAELKIASADITDNRLRLGLEDGTVIEIWDSGQNCCESRYVTCDDNVQSLVGHALRRIDEKHSASAEHGYGDIHETVFVEVGTDVGFITLVNHNEHNGYYGGFDLTVTTKVPR